MMNTKSKTALEEFVEGSVDLSPEEARVRIDESYRAGRVVETSLRQCRRLTGLADAIEDLAVVATRIERTTRTEVRLIETAADMAAVGTTIAPQNFVPAVEQYIGKAIAVEDWVEKAANIAKAVLKQMAIIWEKIEEFFKVVFVIPNMQKGIALRLDQLKRVEDIPDAKPEVAIPNRLMALRIGGMLGYTGSGDVSKVTLKHLIDGAKDFTSNIDYVYTVYMRTAADKAVAAGNRLGQFMFDNPMPAAKNLVADLTRLSPGAPPPKSTAASLYINKDGIRIRTVPGQEIFGNMQLMQVSYEAVKATEVTDVLRCLARQKLILSDAHNNSPQESDTETLMVRLKPDDIANILKAANGILEVLSSFYVGNEYRKVRDARGKLEKETKEGMEDLSKLDPSKLGGHSLGATETSELFNSMLGFNAAYAGWIKDPSMALFTKSMNVVRNLVSVADAQLHTYQLKTK
jgi:hypothetical protein